MDALSLPEMAFFVWVRDSGRVVRGPHPSGAMIHESRSESAAINNIGLAQLWLSALVTLNTGWDYMRAGVRHMID